MSSAPSPKTNKLFSLQIENSDKKLYTLKLSVASNKLEICITNDEFLSLSYMASFQIEDLNKINKFFRQFDSVEEVFDYIVDLDELKEKLTIITEDKFVKFKISIPTASKTKNNCEIEIMVPGVEVKDSDLIIKLCQKVEKINILEKKISYLFDYIGKTEKDFDNYLKIKDSVNHLNNIESSIITKVDFATVSIGIKEKLNKRSKIIISRFKRWRFYPISF